MASTKVNCITINTDASFHPLYRTSGYTFYIVCDLFKIQKSGNFKRQPKSPQEAEMMCIGNAIGLLLLMKELPEANLLVINNDCQFGMTEIQAGRSELGKTINGLKVKLRAKLGKAKIDFRYVKAHNGSPDARSWVNEWCDTEAKKWQRKQTAEVKEWFPLYQKMNLQKGDRVKHEDYSGAIFTVKKIDRIKNIVYTTGGKNGSWINPIELITKL